MLVGAGAMLLPGVAAATTPTVSESFSSPTIPLSNGTGTLTFTIDNPDRSSHTVSFDDTLPAGLQVVGNPSSTCGTSVQLSFGPSNITFVDATLSDPECTVSASVKGIEVGAWDNPVAVTVDGLTPTSADASVDVAAPPAISAAFGTALLGLDGTTSLTFTITNPNQALSLTGVGFTDTLPSGLVILSQPTNTCGGTVTGATGSNSVGLSGGQMPPASTCTVSAPIVATATGPLTDTTNQIISTEGGIGNTASAGLTVIGAPTISLRSPVGGRRYAFGQRVRADYSCADDPKGPGISSCVGDVASGALIATSKAGAHHFTVTARSQDGGVGTEIAFYTVAPDNRFKVGRPRVQPNGSIKFVVKVPGPGAVAVVESVGKRSFARGQAPARRAGNVRLTARPSARGRLAMQQERVKRVSVAVAFTPRGGTRRVVRLSLAA